MNIHSSFYSMNIKLIDLFKSQSTFECRILIFLSIYFSLTFLLVLQTSHATSFIFQKIYSLNGNQNISLEIEAFTQLSSTRYWFWRVFIGNSFNLLSQYIRHFQFQNFFNILKNVSVFLFCCIHSIQFKTNILNIDIKILNKIWINWL